MLSTLFKTMRSQGAANRGVNLTLNGFLVRWVLCVSQFNGLIAFAEEPAAKGTVDIYQNAMQAISEGRYTNARTLLDQLASQEPENAGAWLDIATLHCSMGNKAQAEALFTEIEKRFAPPASIREVMADQLTTDCKPPKLASFTRLRLGRGVDTNANQGASNPNFSFGSGGNVVNLILSPEFTPKRDTFTALSTEFAQVLSLEETLGFVHLQARQYDSLSKYDMTSLAVGVEKPWYLDSWSLRGTGTLSLMTLGGQTYQRQSQLQLLLTPPLTLPAGLTLGLLNSWTNVTYPTLSGFDSYLWESRGQLTYKTAKTVVQANAGYAFDKGSDLRPGNDRRGAVAGVSGQKLLGSNVLGELGWSYQQWNGSRAYSPSLIDTQRQQETQLLRLALTYPVAPQHALHLEYKDVRNKENISLFTYKGKMLQLSWEWRQ
jgi:hypothetical protein